MLRLEGITKVFNPGSQDEKRALNNVSLHLKPGDFATIIGSNGAGKSTLMNIISGVLPSDQGKIWIDGERVDGLPEYKRAAMIGRVFQDPMAGTSPNMSIEENLSMAYIRGKRRGLRRGVTRQQRQYFREMLASLGIGLENRLTAKVGLLSGGERQALSLLMATMNQPKILLLDEHTAALDPNRAQLVTQLTEKVVRENRLTTLMVTHNMEQAILLGNRLIMMDKGEIILDISGEEKQQLTVSKLLDHFRHIKGKELADERMVLS
jgi:putative ABC transport system ATP-binding protein